MKIFSKEIFSIVYFCPIPFNKMKMKNLSVLMSLAAAVALAGCGKIGKSHKGLPDDGQLHGVAPPAGTI